MDIVRRGFTTGVALAVIAYVVYLLIQSAQVVSPEFAGMNILWLLGIALIAGYIGLVYGIYPLYNPRQKRIFLILGVGLIFFGEIVFINDSSQAIYASDIVKLFGVLIVWFGATGLLSKTKAITQWKTKHKHSNATVIEA